MDNERKLRLIQVAKEFKVGLNTIVDHLQKKGITTDGTPNTKVTDEMYAILEKEFGINRSSGNERNAVREKIAQKQAAVTIESPKQQAKEEEELVVKSNVISVKDEIQKPKILGKIDLNPKPAVKKEEPKAEPVKVEEPKVEPVKTAEPAPKAVESPKVEAPKAEPAKVEEAPVEKKADNVFRPSVGTLAGPQILCTMDVSGMVPGG